MTTVSNKQKWFNTIRLTEDDGLFVGIDTHKKSPHVALWLNDAAEHLRPADKVIEHLVELSLSDLNALCR